VSKTLRTASAPKVEVDHRSREARRRLAQVEGLLVPWVPPTRSWVRQGLYWLAFHAMIGSATGSEGRTGE